MPELKPATHDSGPLARTKPLPQSTPEAPGGRWGQTACPPGSSRRLPLQARTPSSRPCAAPPLTSRYRQRGEDTRQISLSSTRADGWEWWGRETAPRTPQVAARPSGHLGRGVQPFRCGQVLGAADPSFPGTVCWCPL